MKKTVLAGFCFALLSLPVTQMAAQKRLVDMEVKIDSPVHEGTYTPGESVPLTVTIFNHGPDNIQYLDTIFVIMPDGNITWGMMEEAVPANGSAELFTSGLTMPSIDSITRLELCIQVIGDPTTQIRMGGVPVAFSYIDPNPSNNYSCNTITIEDIASGVGGVAGTTLDLKFVPNPAKSLVHIPIGTKHGDIFTVVFRDVLGKIILKKQLSNVSVSQSLDVDISSLNDGLYLVEIHTTLGVHTGKLVVGQ